VEEVDSEHRGLRVQEMAPGRVGVPLGYLQGLENPDGGRADPVTELEKLP